MTPGWQPDPDALQFEWLPGEYAVCRLDADAPLPEWADFKSINSGLLCATRTDRELSIIVQAKHVPPGVRAERSFTAMRIVGTLDFNLVGILAKLTGALAEAGIAAFAISTYETDLLLIRCNDQDRAANALKQVGKFNS